MALATYSDLQASIASYLARSDLTVQIPDFIRLTEIRLRRDVRIRQMLKLSFTAMTGSTVGLPNDFLEMRNLYLETNPEQPLTYQTPSIFTRDGLAQESGQPRNYTILSDEIQVSPAPNGQFNIYMLYYAAPAFLSNANTSNVFMAQCPDLLLYGSLVEAEPYLMNDNRLAVWAGMFQRGLDSLTTSDDRGEYSGAPISMKVARR
jgi:hypothetical protein